MKYEQLENFFKCFLTLICSLYKCSSKCYPGRCCTEECASRNQCASAERNKSASSYVNYYHVSCILIGWETWKEVQANVNAQLKFVFHDLQMFKNTLSGNLR